MRRLLLVGSLLVSGTAAAWMDIPENPDRYVSLALHGNKGDLEAGSGNESDLTEIGGSLRIPFAANATFEVSMATNQQDLTLGNLKTDFKGKVYGASLRYYFIPNPPRD